MAEVDTITSVNRPGRSTIEVEIRSVHDGAELPAGAGPPRVNERFRDVFGIYYAVTAQGFSETERHRLAAFLRREMLAVDGVADVEVAEFPPETIFVEQNLTLTVNLNVPPLAIVNAIASANLVVPAGGVENTTTRTIIRAPDGSDTVSELAGLSIGAGGEVIDLVDLAEVHRGRAEHPDLPIRSNGVEAITVGIAGLATENIIAVGENVDARLTALLRDLPHRVEPRPNCRQHRVVDEASSSALLSLALSVGIEAGVLALFMGWRSSVAVGATLFLAVVGTFVFMALFSIAMERISLGALIIAMGMLVDNAIVVAEGMQTAMARGKLAQDAAPAPRRNRHGHYGLCRDRSQPGCDRRVPVLALCGRRHLAPAVVVARPDSHPPSRALRLPSRTRCRRGSLRGEGVSRLWGAPSPLPHKARGRRGGAGRGDGGRLRGVRPDSGNSSFPTPTCPCSSCTTSCPREPQSGPRRGTSPRSSRGLSIGTRWCPWPRSSGRGPRASCSPPKRSSPTRAMVT